jgi:hypothetical protein
MKKIRTPPGTNAIFGKTRLTVSSDAGAMKAGCGVATRDIGSRISVSRSDNIFANALVIRPFHLSAKRTISREGNSLQRSRHTYPDRNKSEIAQSRYNAL